VVELMQGPEFKPPRKKKRSLNVTNSTQITEGKGVRNQKERQDLGTHHTDEETGRCKELWRPKLTAWP
jgi:hypothetical protein